MKKLLIAIFLLITILILFKLNTAKPEEYLVKINNYTITPQEFNQEFLASAYAKNDTPQSRKEFLDMLIRRKLVIQDAQARGLDKDKEFLKSIERFWEQSLLKRVMDEKSKEVNGSVVVADKAVEAIYNKLKSEGKTDKSYEEMYNPLKWSLVKIEESRTIDKWLTSLYEKSDIRINSKYFPKQSEK